MRRAFAAWILLVASASVRADGLKPAPPAPSEGQSTQFVLITAELLAQIEAVIEAQRREIERLRKAKTTEECS